MHIYKVAMVSSSAETKEFAELKQLEIVVLFALMDAVIQSALFVWSLIEMFTTILGV